MELRFEFVDRDIKDLQDTAESLVKMRPHSDDLTEFYRVLRIMYAKCFSYKLVYMEMLKAENKREEDVYASKTQSLIVKGYTQAERETIRNIGSTSQMKQVKEVLSLIDVIMEHSKALERAAYGLMQVSQLDLKLAGLGHN